MQRQNYMITAEEVCREHGDFTWYMLTTASQTEQRACRSGICNRSGKIPRAFWEKKFYGYSQIAM